MLRLKKCLVNCNESFLGLIMYCLSSWLIHAIRITITTWRWQLSFYIFCDKISEKANYMQTEIFNQWFGIVDCELYQYSIIVWGIKGFMPWRTLVSETCLVYSPTVLGRGWYKRHSFIIIIHMNLKTLII